MEINFDNDAQNMVDFINKSAREHEVKNERTGRKKNRILCFNFVHVFVNLTLNFFVLLFWGFLVDNESLSN